MNLKINTVALKAKHRLELVMQEMGERFEVENNNPDQLRSLVSYGLIVDIRKQIYTITRPGLEVESGDLYDWLQRRFSWNFLMAVKFLQKRPTDQVKQIAIPTKVEKLSQPLFEIEGDQPSDYWQEKALKLGGNGIRRYFSKPLNELLELINVLPARFMPVQAIDVDDCSECGKPFDWEDDHTIAYFCQGQEYGGEVMPQDEQGKFILDVYMEGVICESCKREKRRNYLSLQYCLRSAWTRSKSELTESVVEIETR